MAIVQISRIQHRKGLQQDLPQLSGAEFGWALDTRKLYIGNGTISEGAASEGVTEILTQYSDLLNIAGAYTFKGSQSGYTSQTGVSALAPILRSLQLKVDDIVNVRDFGATGDGTTNDTAALQRAIDQIYFGGFSLSQNKLRRVINIPAGIYIIDNSIKLNSHVILRGEGKDRTIIIQTNVSYPVIQLKDNLGQYDDAYVTNGGVPAVNITVEQMTLVHQQTKDLVTIDTSTDIVFRSVKFTGAKPVTDSAIITGANAQNAVYMVPRTIDGQDPGNGAVLGPIENVLFVDCEVDACVQGLIVNARNVHVLNCTFTRLSNAIWFDYANLSSADARNLKVIGCTFETVYRSGIKVTTKYGDPVGVTSTGNHFGRVGYVTGSTSPSSSPIDFDGSSCVSIGDTFDREFSDELVVPSVTVGAIKEGTVKLDANVGLTMGRHTLGSGKRFVVTPTELGIQANTGIFFTSTPAKHKVDYIIERGDYYRYGTITLVVNNAGSTLNMEYEDDYTDYPETQSYYTYPGMTATTLEFQPDGDPPQRAVLWANLTPLPQNDDAIITYTITTIK
jgi:Pectate lyase superfamily protein